MGVVPRNGYLIDATRSIDSARDVSAEACVCQGYSADDIDSDGENTQAWNYLTTSSLWDSHQSTFGLPVYDRQQSLICYKSSGIDNIIRLVLIQFSAYILRILQSGLSLINRESTVLQKLNYLTSNPTVFSEYQKRLLGVTERVVLPTILLLIK